MKTVEIEPTFEGWQAAARALLRESVPPADVRWREGANSRQPSLHAEPSLSSAVKVPREFLELARQAAAAPDPTRWQVLYDVLWRLAHENRDLLKDVRDPGVRRLRALVTRNAAGAEPHGEAAATLVPAGASLRELTLFKPEILVCLGATAARAIFGDKFRITKDRGHFAPTRWAAKTIATYHPSAVLRGEDDAQKAELYGMLLEDLRKVASA